jgi:hypothetical protein
LKECKTQVEKRFGAAFFTLLLQVALVAQERFLSSVKKTTVWENSTEPARQLLCATAADQKQ